MALIFIVSLDRHLWMLDGFGTEVRWWWCGWHVAGMVLDEVEH